MCVRDYSYACVYTYIYITDFITEQDMVILMFVDITPSVIGGIYSNGTTWTLENGKRKEWGTAGTEIKVPHGGIPGLSNVNSF